MVSVSDGLLSSLDLSVLDSPNYRHQQFETELSKAENHKKNNETIWATVKGEEPERGRQGDILNLKWLHRKPATDTAKATPNLNRIGLTLFVFFKIPIQRLFWLAT